MIKNIVIGDTRPLDIRGFYLVSFFKDKVYCIGCSQFSEMCLKHLHGKGPGIYLCSGPAQLLNFYKFAEL